MRLESTIQINANRMTSEFCLIGFPDEERLLAELGRSLQIEPVFAQHRYFAAGEVCVRGQECVPKTAIIGTNIHAQPEQLWRACLLAQSLRHHGAERVLLLSPWIAYGRQDRIVERGSASAGLLMGKWLSDIFDRIYTFDAHSQRFIDAFQGKLRNIHGSPLLIPSLQRATIVIAPDEGAIARANHAASLLQLPVLILQKERTNQGVAIHLPTTDLQWSEHIPLLVDDMTDTGGTLLTAARILKKAGVREILAFVPHILRRSVLQSKSEGVINRVEMVFDHEADAYSPGQLSLLTEALLTEEKHLSA